MGSSGRTLAILGILLAALALAPAQAGSRGRGHRTPHRHHAAGGSAKWPRLIWSDNFNGPAGASPNPSKWSFDTGNWGNKELDYYTSRPANAELDGRGHLVLSARAETSAGPGGAIRSYTSARLETLREFQFTYGLAEARIKVPAGLGLLPAFWMLGNNAYEPDGWPAAGEIDTMEVVGSRPYVVNGTIHGPWPSVRNEVNASLRSASSLASGFHVYGVEWEPDRISFLLDGHTYKTITPADLPAGSTWPFQHPFFLLLDLAVGGEWAGSPNASTHFPAQMTIDWVRVWQ